MQYLRQTLDAFLNGELTHVVKSPVLVAVSGGLDSMVLLHLLMHYCREREYTLIAIHVNHGLRATAMRDQQHVENACEMWGIPCYSRAVDLASISLQHGKSFEADARRLRYQEIFAVANEVGAHHVALAHHADDQVETFLWRWLRGSGLTGLAAMRPVVTRNEIRLLRPLLSIRKADLATYATAHNITYCIDETNADLRYTRNYIRHEVIPRLEHIQPEVSRVTERLTRMMREEDAWLHQLAQDLVDTSVRKQGEYVKFSTTEWRSHPIPLQRRAIQILLYCFASIDWGYAHIEAVIQLITAQSPSARLSLPHNLVAWREYDGLLLGRILAQSFHQVDEVSWVLADDAKLAWGASRENVAWQFACAAWHGENSSIHRKSPYQLLIPRCDELTVKKSVTSARMRILGLGGTKKVQDIFTDCKIPRMMRANWPSVYVGDDLLWLPGLARSDQLLQPLDARTGWLITVTASTENGAYEGTW